jgi:hypothetical protein
VPVEQYALMDMSDFRIQQSTLSNKDNCNENDGRFVGDCGKDADCNGD